MQQGHSSTKTLAKLEKKIEQLPPHDERAEQSVIGACLISSQACSLAVNEINAGDFYIPRHQVAFKAVRKVFERLGDVDEITLCSELGEELEAAGGRDYIGSLVVLTPSAAGIEGYIEAVQRKKWDRIAIRQAAELLEGARLGNSKERLKPDLASIASDDRISQQIEDEISGVRTTIEFPNMRTLTNTEALSSGSLTVLCGSPGASKSLLVGEWVWRWCLDHGVKAAILELEKGADFHLRRAAAQMVKFPKYTNARWVAENPDLAREIRRRSGKRVKALAPSVHAPTINERADAGYIRKWAKKEFESGTRIIVVDPITALQGGAIRNQDHERVVTDLNALVAHYNTSAILVTHPKKGYPGVPVEPSLDNLPNSSAYERFSDTILWMEAHEDMEHPLGKYNRTIHCLKVRLSSNPGIVRLRFDGNTLCHTEIG